MVGACHAPAVPPAMLLARARGMAGGMAGSTVELGMSVAAVVICASTPDARLHLRRAAVVQVPHRRRGRARARRERVQLCARRCGKGGGLCAPLADLAPCVEARGLPCAVPCSAPPSPPLPIHGSWPAAHSVEARHELPLEDPSLRRPFAPLEDPSPSRFLHSLTGSSGIFTEWSSMTVVVSDLEMPGAASAIALNRFEI